jgi:hypothetical protein
LVLETFKGSYEVQPEGKELVEAISNIPMMPAGREVGAFALMKSRFLNGGLISLLVKVGFGQVPCVSVLEGKAVPAVLPPIPTGVPVEALRKVSV